MAGIVSTRADPLTFLSVRHGCSIVVFTVLSVAVKAAWPRDIRTWRDAMIAGMLLHGFYIGGVFWAVSQGMGAGMMGLITGLHPLFTALLAAPLLRERLAGRQWAGIAVGIAGVAMIVSPKLGGADGVPLVALASALVATLAFTLGTIWQKRAHPTLDLRVNATIQFMGALALTLPVMWATESRHFDNSLALWGALAWAVLGLSIGGISILLLLLRKLPASKVAPLLYFSPAVAALMALVLFGEKLTLIQLAGMALAVVGAFWARSAGSRT